MPRVDTALGTFVVENGRWTGDLAPMVAWLNTQDLGRNDVRRALDAAAILDGEVSDLPSHDDVRDMRTLGGPGSGHFGHAGRKGHVGGSVSSGRVQLSTEESELLDTWRSGDATIYDDLRIPGQSFGIEMTYLLRRMPAYEGTVYRGVDLDDNDLAKLKAAKTFTVEMHSSASQDREVAEQFLENDLVSGWNKVLLEFRNSNAANITGQGTPVGDWEELEVVVMAGTRWRQVEVVEEYNRTHIILESAR
jgi:hypothetical protein